MGTINSWKELQNMESLACRTRGLGVFSGLNDRINDKRGYNVDSSSHSGLFIYQNQDRDRPSKIPNPHVVVFQVCIQNRYKLNKKYRKWLALSNGDKPEDKGLLAQAKVAADAENADNNAEQKRQLGKKVRYGEIVQLKHVFTNKYIHMCTSQTSQKDKNNMMIMLQDFNAKNAQFRILPQYKVKSEGEVVQIYDQIVFESIKSPGHYFHGSVPFQIDISTFGSELNLGVERSGFTLVRYCKENPDIDLYVKRGISQIPKYIKGGSVIRLFHKELEAYLVAEGLFDEEVTEDVHFRIRVMDQHKPRTLSPPSSGNTFWQIECENGILNGDVIRWEQQVRLRHMTIRKYLRVDANREITLTDDNEDPRTVFRLHSVLSFSLSSDLSRQINLFKDIAENLWINKINRFSLMERDEIHFESYARIEHVLTGFWLHALKDEDYIRKQFRHIDDTTDQSMRGLRWDTAQVRQVAASGESMYDDAFTIQFVEKQFVDDFNYVSGMVPCLLSLIYDRAEGHILNAKKTHQTLTAMEELRKFMFVQGLTSKNRQKLMRNLRVIDLLVKILQCPLNGVPDEANLIQVFKEAYDTLYTYMIGKSRKNALYFAKYIDFFQTQFTQKGGIGLNVAQMIVELIRDKRKIVDRITHSQIDEFVSLLQTSQNYRFLDLLHVLCVCDDIAIPNNQSYIVKRWLQCEKKGVYLTARGQDINRQPNILYLSTSNGQDWMALHEFVDESNPYYNKDQHEFLIHQLDLYKALSYGRNDYASNIITKELRYLTWEETFLSLRSDILPDAIRAKYCDLTTSLFVDVGNNYSVLDHPNICFVYDYVGSKDEEKSQGDFVIKELVAIFPVLRDWIAEFLRDNSFMIACNIGHNMLIEQVLRLLYHLVKFGYYLDAEDVRNLLPPLLNLLDGRHDYPFPQDKEKGYSKDAMKSVTQYQLVDRYLVCPETLAIVNAKFQALEVLDLLLTYQRNSRLQSFVGKFKIAEISTTQKRQNVLTPMLYEQFNPHDQSKKALKKQRQIIKELRDMFNSSAIFDVELLTKILMDLSQYKYNKMITKSLNILNKVYSSKTNMFKLSTKAVVLLTQDSARVHREVLKNLPLLRRLARAKLDDQQVKLMCSILDDMAEFCHLPMTPDEPHPMNQNILISNGILHILFDILVQDIDIKLFLLARENERVQFYIFERLDVLLEVRVVESDLAIALREVFSGNQNTCLKINPRQIQKVVNRAAELQERGPEFLDLLGMIVKVTGTGLTLKRNQAFVMKYIMQNYKKVAFVLDTTQEEREVILTLTDRVSTLRYLLSLLDLLAACAEGENMFIESLCQTILPMEDLLWVLNNPAVENLLKKPFLRCLHHVYMKSNGATVDVSTSEIPHDSDLWEYLQSLTTELNKVTDTAKEDPDKLAANLKSPPTKPGGDGFHAADSESSVYGTVLYMLEGCFPFLETFFKEFYFPDHSTNGNEIEITDQLAKAILVFSETTGPLLYKPNHMKNMVNALTVLIPISNLSNSSLENVLERFGSGITVEDTSCAIRRGNIEYYADEVDLNTKFRFFAKSAAVVFAGHNSVNAQLKLKSKREYTIIGGDEELPLGDEFQSLVKCFVNAHEKKPAKKVESASKLIEQLDISQESKRLSETAKQEMDELNIKCLQVLRAIIHNEERKLPEDWETRTSEPKIQAQLKIISTIQNFYDARGSMNKSLPHLASRNDEIAKEVLAFLCIMLFNANAVVQSSMLKYFLSTREEVFFMAVRDRMALSTNSIKEKRSLQAQQDAKLKDAPTGGKKTVSTFAVSLAALKQIKAYEDALRQQRIGGWATKKKPPGKKKKQKKPKEPKKRKEPKKVKKETQANGLKKEVNFTNPLVIKEDQALIDPPEHELEIAVQIESEPEPEPAQAEETNAALEYRNDGYIELVLKVMARMCDGQNKQLQDYLREQPDNVKSFDIIAEVTRFLNVVYSNITGKNIDLVIQLFETMNEFTAGNQENRIVIYDNKIIDYINFIMRAGDFDNCITDKILELRQSIANLVMSLIEENGDGPSQVAMEVKDTLDKKAVVALMTECYEMHQPDKNRKEDMKLAMMAAGGGSTGALSTAKTFAMAGGSFLQGVVKKEKNEFAEQYMDVGFSLYLLLNRMHDTDSKLIENIKLQPLQQKAFNFYKKNSMSIEIVKEDDLQKINFRVKNKRVLREEVKEKLKWGVNRSSPSNKIRDLMAWTKDIMKDIAYQQRILSNFIAICLTKGWLFWNHGVTIISFAINILMLVTWKAKGSLETPGIMDNATGIPHAIIDPVPSIINLGQSSYEITIKTLGGAHNFFSLLVLISYFVCNHPRLPDFKSIMTSCKSKFKKKSDDDEIDKKKEHQSKLDAQFFSFTTFYYMVFLALSIGGTFTSGYFFAFHLLNIVNNNQLLSGVIKAVTQNGKSLLWVAVLGLVVFYLYGIIGFALMRSMFDPKDYLYCNTLWQCTITVVRYGLIGDLFEVMNPHDNEKTFEKFGVVVLYHVSFFIFITTIGLNIIFGIIVDTFSELRDLKWTAESDMRDICFICSRNSYDFEHHGKGFDHHVRYEHNMWAYIFFFIHLNGTKVNDYTALEMYVYKLLQKENFDFFPLDRALSLSSMGKDSTETKLDDLLYQVTTIVEKQRVEELEKKRREERMRQKIWEQKHRLGSFRRKARLPGPTEPDPLMQLQGASGQLDESNRLLQLSPLAQLAQLGQQVARRASMGGEHRADMGPTLRQHSIASSHGRHGRGGGGGGSPLRHDSTEQRYFRGSSPSRYDEEPFPRNLSPVRYDDRTRSPSRSRHGSEPDLMGLSPVHSRREPSRDYGMLSPKWVESRATSPRGASIFFPDSDSLSVHSLRDAPPSGQLPDPYLDSIETGPFLIDPPEPQRSTSRDTESAESGNSGDFTRLETRL
ncbi:hypothetical protein LOTGIDRAFT_163525 [Lottia gigantea]|uniref:Inositol 1,4,5-trisphosphate receptor n=1 Tax=Lottia gigantea TaxID=225164 RepID=V4BQ56_LOTGI|nr:hypothetical protein LOTGIDRAFT_163525 [Lottia gigantea]ESO91009.1 hypothetical protein LOTGIDRAFT_163525 [Lottia gigantea]